MHTGHLQPLLLLCTIITTTVLAYHPPQRPPHAHLSACRPALHTRGSFLSVSSVGATAAALLGLAPASNAASSSSSTTITKDLEGGATVREKGRPALLEALVYLPKGVNYWGELLPGANEEKEDISSVAGGTHTGTEAMFLTASFQGKLVLGARVPMEGVMFPFLAQFYEGNILDGAGGWQEAKAQDLVVRARVCATGEYPPCGTPLLKAASLSKFLPEVRDPNNPRSEEVIARNVRIGASLMLQPVGEATTLERMRMVQDNALGRT
eukprot:evm.model.NODE_16360_length_8486_cov_28.441315.1